MDNIDRLAPDAAQRQNEVHEGTALIAVGTRDVPLTTGKVYHALFGAEEGIFHSRPFVTVIDDNRHLYSCHLSRFHIADTNNGH